MCVLPRLDRLLNGPLLTIAVISIIDMDSAALRALCQLSEAVGCFATERSKCRFPGRPQTEVEWPN